MTTFQRTLVGAAAVGLAALLAYAPALRGEFIWDDDVHIVRNATLKNADGLARIWVEPKSIPQYYPLVHTTFWLERRLWGLNPAGYHTVNLLLHLAGAWLWWRLLRALKMPGAGLAAAIFALHPVQVESVAWITERKNVLSGLFYTASFFMLVRAWGLDLSARGASSLRSGGKAPREGAPRALQEGEAAEPRSFRQQLRLYGCGAGLFVCALLSKTVTATLPAALLLAVWWKRGKLTWKDFAAAGPLLALGAVMGWHTKWLEEHFVGAAGAEWSFGFVERCLIAGRALWFYAGKLVWPQPLAFIYPRWTIDSHAVWPYLFPLGVLVLAGVLLLKRAALGRGPLAGLLFFAGTLFPALGFFNVYPMRYSFVADHFQYLAAMGVIAPVAALWGRWRDSGSAGRARWLAPVLLGALAALTWRQAALYRTKEALWSDTLRKNPECWMARQNLANVRVAQGRVDEAIRDYETALQQKADNPEAHNNLGNLYRDRGETVRAVAHFEAAVTVAPGFAPAWYNLGLMAARNGRTGEALRFFEETLKRRPDSVEAHNNAGSLLLRRGNTNEALAHFNRALELDPDSVEAHNNLGNLLADQGKPKEACWHFRLAIEIAPEAAEARNNIGVLFAGQGRLKAAEAHFEKALRLNPRFDEARRNLERARAQMKAGTRSNAVDATRR